MLLELRRDLDERDDLDDLPLPWRSPDESFSSSSSELKVLSLLLFGVLVDFALAVEFLLWLANAWLSFLIRMFLVLAVTGVVIPYSFSFFLSSSSA